MKKPLYLLIAVVAVAILFSFNDDSKGLARVQKLQGVEVYVMSEPLRDYSVVEKITDGGVMLKGCEVQNLVEMFVNKAHRKKTQFDAIIIDGNSKATLIKWK